MVGGGVMGCVVGGGNGVGCGVGVGGWWCGCGVGVGVVKLNFMDRYGKLNIFSWFKLLWTGWWLGGWWWWGGWVGGKVGCSFDVGCRGGWCASEGWGGW